jgi:FemAB-related protein (PEP-CTERM system-associated)
MIRVVDWSGAPETWDRFVLGASDSTIMHLHGWRAVMQAAYGHRTTYLAAMDADDVRGVLPLTLVRHPVLPGRALVSMPFMDYGGACVAGDEKAEALLVEAGREVARRHGATLALRYARRAALPLACSLDKVTMLLPLEPDEDRVWARLRSERRNRIRKGQKQGLTATVDGPEALDDFYAVFAENMRDLGSPVHSREFFRLVVAHLGEHVRILVVRSGSEAVGAAMMLLYQGVISIPWVSSRRRYFAQYPNQVLYWEAIRFGIAHGFRALDFGRSSVGSGTFEAKRQWGAEPAQLYWYYYPDTAAPAGRDLSRVSWMVPVWKRLPLPVANTLGPWLRRAIPN